jgi:hypothetical protein
MLPQSLFSRGLLAALAVLSVARWSAGVVPAPASALPGLPPPPLPPLPRLHHLTVSTRQEAGLVLLLESAARLGYSSSVLGLNETRPLGHWASAFGLKMMLVRDAVAPLPPLDWVLFTDAFDVVFQRPAAELLAALEAWGARSGNGSRLLFTAELYEWPDEGLPYATRHLRLPFLNSGVYAGRARDVLRAVDSGGYDLSTDDQRFFTQQHLAGGAGAPALDHAQEYFASMAGLSPGVEYELVAPSGSGSSSVASAQLPLVVPTQGGGVAGRAPYVLHFNGAHGKKHFFGTAGHVLGERGAYLAERAAWVYGLRYWLMLPFREAMIVVLPWRARAAVRRAGLTDEVALALPVVLALALRWWWLRAGSSSRAAKRGTLSA